MKFPKVLRALSSRNYRIYTIGQGFSLIGTWMHQLAMSWLVYRLTGSSTLLGAAVFASQIPMLFLSPFAGVLVDRLNKKTVLICSQSILMGQAALLAFLTWANMIEVWHIMVLNLLFGIVNSLDMPTRQSLVPDLVEHRQDLGNAIALNATIVNITRLIGPAVGGYLIFLLNESACFAINAVSFCCVIFSLILIRVPHRLTSSEQNKPVLSGFRDGMAYVRDSEPIGTLLVLLSIVSLVGMPYTVFMPIFAREILSGTAATMGLLTASSGLGALTAAVYLASRGTVRGLLRRIAAGVVLFGLGLVAFSRSNQLIFSEIALFIAGFGVMIVMAASNTVLQMLSDDHMRGRVMSLYVTSLMGISPIGALAMGAIASHVGVTATVLSGGLLCVLGAVMFMARIPILKMKMRPIYIQRGIVPSPGLGAAAELSGPLK